MRSNTDPRNTVSAVARQVFNQFCLPSIWTTFLAQTARASQSRSLTGLATGQYLWRTIRYTMPAQLPTQDAFPRAPARREDPS